MDNNKRKRKSNLPLEDINFCEVKEENTENESNFSSDAEDCEMLEYCGSVTGLKEINQLRNWVIENEIPHAHVDELLKILRVRLLPSLPASAKTFLKNNPIQCNVDPLTNSSTRIGQKSGKTKATAVQKNVESSDKTDNSFQNPLEVVADLNLPILQMSNIQSKTDFERTVLSELSFIKTGISELKKNQDNASNYLLDKKVVNLANSKINFEEKYNIRLPLTTLEDFLQFDELLKSNKYLKNDVCLELMTCIDKDYVLSRSFVVMLKKFMTKDAAIQFTTVRKSRKYSDQNKQIFKQTELCRCMDAIMISKRNTEGLWTDEKDLVTAMSEVLCNVKKWNITKVPNSQFNS